MAIQVFPTIFDDAKIFIPDVYDDDRGYFKETWSDPKYAAVGLDVRWAQDSVSWSSRDVIRGMHYDPRMAKLVQCLRGRIWDVIVDLRRGSPTYAKWQGVTLSAANHRQLFVPAGFAHGFLALEDDVVVHYKNSVPFDPAVEGAISWRSTRVGIRWPLGGRTPRLSSKDEDISPDVLPEL